MRAFTSTSKAAKAALALCLLSTAAWAEGPAPADGAAPKGEKEERTNAPEDEGFDDTPFTEYGEFNEQEEEDAETKFFQHGRFFGVSLGAGYEGVTGNRGLVWQGGLPAVDLKVHCWFDFNTAIQLGITSAGHFYNDPELDSVVDANVVRLGLDFKYYFDTKDLSAAITFANPFVLVGGGAYAKTEVNEDQGVKNEDTTFGANLGAGFEFPISPKKAYLVLEGKLHYIAFKDVRSTRFAKDFGALNLTGLFYTTTIGVMFTW